MKKTIIGIFAALALVACEKEVTTTTTSTGSTGSITNIELNSTNVPDERTFDQLDANTITNDLTIEDATKTTGTPPAPSIEIDAPVLNNYGNGNYHGVQGENIRINLNVSQGNVAGIYMKVPGADDYFDIPVQNGSNKKDNDHSLFDHATSTESLQFRSSSNEFLELELPDNLEGEFCFNYCVYDSTGYVSNVVSQCVVIETIGGNLPFNTKTWEALYFLYADENGQEKEEIGVVDYYRDTITNCYDTLTNANIDTELIIAEEYRMDNLIFTFNTDGTFEYSAEGYEKNATNYNYGVCNDGPITYTEETDNEYLTGWWSYDDATKLLVLILNDEGYREAVEMTVVTEGNQMMLIFGDEDEIEALVFKKQ
tara:strand:- start:757 stop:1863 length:1107 start_codon:yes stop_codon:yes gene_type:complete